MRVTLSVGGRCVGTERVDGEHDAKRLFVPYLYLFEGGCEFKNRNS